jgi:hypothetical protein
VAVCLPKRCCCREGALQVELAPVRSAKVAHVKG